MPKIVYILCAITTVQTYALMYAIAAAVTWDAFRCALNPFNLPRILREFIGALARMRGTTVKLTGSWGDILGLNPESATELSIDQAVARLTSQMRARRWAYPASQYQILEKVADTAVYAVYCRDRNRQAQEEINRFYEALQQRQAQTSWRQVLGIAPQERDTEAVKRAYRKLALRAHPDRGGSNADMAVLNAAMAQARQELAFV